jgi:multicomponent Na+:H+ antiporter subunit E
MTSRRTAVTRTFALACWVMGVWVLLTWTRTAEQLIVGAVLSVAVAVALAPLGDVAGPWRLLDPRVAKRLAGLTFVALRRILIANLRLARRIWSPSLPLRSGMVIVPTTQRSELGLTTVGVVSSLIVDNQIVDVDRSRGRLLYHAVDVPPRDREVAREQINGPLERYLPEEGS